MTFETSLPDRARLAIFDCDGVLVDSEWLANMVVGRELGALGVATDEVDLAQRFTGRTTPEMVATLADEAGVTLPPGFVIAVEDAIDLALRSEVTEIEGAAAFLSRMTGARGIASNSGADRVRASLDKAGLAGYFDPATIFAAERVSRPKPAPDIYNLAFESLGGRRDDTVVVEDSVAGVTAAHQAGLPVIGFAGGSHTPPGHGEALLTAGAALVVAGYDALLPVFDDLGLLG
ncbi:HAD family phosphatase [Fodinicurvata sp. EGI_FJ10296]|uniref:HAD family hydrolase n=1 Tax=Fodinicurvata sp. EGI_FJ10296 TaxID=3231908 RepID=UPI0034512A19